MRKYLSIRDKITCTTNSTCSSPNNTLISRDNHGNSRCVAAGLFLKKTAPIHCEVNTLTFYIPP